MSGGHATVPVLSFFPTVVVLTKQISGIGPQNSLKEDILQEINENHRDDTQYGQPKCPGGTQEIPRQQKERISESTRTNKINH
jgi:hypothetical protein